MILEDSQIIGFRLAPDNQVFIKVDSGEEDLYFRDEFISILEPLLLDSLEGYKLLRNIHNAFIENSSRYYILDRVEGTLQAYPFEPVKKDEELYVSSQLVSSSLSSAMKSIGIAELELNH